MVISAHWKLHLFFAVRLGSFRNFAFKFLITLFMLGVHPQLILVFFLNNLQHFRWYWKCFSNNFSRCSNFHNTFIFQVCMWWCYIPSMYVIVLHSKYVCDSVTLLFTESFFYKWYSSSQIMDYGQIIPSSLQIPLAINFHPRRGMGGRG